MLCINSDISPEEVLADLEQECLLLQSVVCRMKQRREDPLTADCLERLTDYLEQHLRDLRVMLK